ncbi:MAG: MFS transporter [Candidatus Cyclobacteriaceae bacterium M3_2C_046]
MNYVQLVKRYPNYLSYGFLHYFFSSIGQTFLISLFVPYFSKDIQITNNTFSLLYGFATVSSAFMLPWAGGLIDRIKLRYSSILNGLLIGSFCLVVSFSQNIFVLFAGILGVRFAGQGIMILIGSTAIARYFGPDRGKALSLSGLGISVAESMLPVLVISLINQIGWPHTWRLLGLAIALTFIPLSLLLVKKNNPFQMAGKQEEASGKGPVKSATRKDVLKDRHFYFLVPLLLFLPFFITGMFIHQNLLAQIKGWSMEWMATCFVGFGLVRILTSLLAGPLIDKLSAQKVFVFYLMPLGLGLILLLLGDSRWLAMGYMILLGITGSLSSLTSTALWAEIYGVHHFGAIKSMVTTMMVFSTAIGPVAIGWFMTSADKLNWLLVISLIIIFILSGLAYFGVKQISRKNAYS